MSFAPVYPHDPIAPVCEDVWMARGSIAMNPIVRISRNMAIVRSGNELTLIDPIRLDDAGLAQLDALGTVRHILRLGAFHGLDDPFYMDRYDAAFWSQPGGITYTEPPIDHELSTETELPFGGGRLFVFERVKEPESALLLDRGAGLLLTCDAIQHYGDYSHNNLPARLLMPFIGFPKRTVVGPVWLKHRTREGDSLEDQFRRLLELRFDTLLAAHGTLLTTGAHDSVRRAVDLAFP